VLATFVFFLPQIADYRDVWAVVKELSWPRFLALAAVTVLNLATFAFPWKAALPGLRFWPAFLMTQASTALSIVVPAGAAVGLASSYGLLRSWGFRGRDVGRAVTLTGLWNQFANLSYPIVAVFLLTSAGGDSPLLATTAFIGVAVLGIVVGAFVLVLASDRTATDVGDIAARGANWARGKIGRTPVWWGGPNFERFRRDTIELLRRRWHVLTLATLAGSLSVFLVLLVSLRALDVPEAEVSTVEAFAAWALVRLIASIPITPGGIGIVELGLTGALVGFGGSNAGVVAAVLVFRFLTIVPTLALGLIAVSTRRRHSPVSPA
jgi:putative heme transporter